jgi:hypothetical protein
MAVPDRKEYLKGYHAGIKEGKLRGLAEGREEIDELKGMVANTPSAASVLKGLLGVTPDGTDTRSLITILEQLIW